MKRHLLNLLTFLSLMLGVAVVVLWGTGGQWAGAWPPPGGWRLPEAWGRLPGSSRAPVAGAKHRLFVVPRGGGMYLVSFGVSQPADGSWVAEVVHADRAVFREPTGRLIADPSTSVRLTPMPALARFEAQHYPDCYTTFSGPKGLAFCATPSHAISVPYWAVSPALAALPLVWFTSRLRRWRPSRRRARGECVRCGYDLRATRGRCPECGAAAGLAGG